MWKVRTHLHVEDLLIFVWAFGHFACWLLFTALTKGVTAPGAGLSGLAILPVTTLASLVGAAVFIVATGWWRSASRCSLGRVSLPRPGRWSFLSGLCSAALIVTTTLAFTFDGISIVLMMLWMRGGVMVMGLITSLISRHKVRGTAWSALALSLAAIFLATGGAPERALSGWAMGMIAAYLLAFFIRAQLLRRVVQTASLLSRSFFVEEQLVATPALLLVLGALSIWGGGPGMHALRAGFTDVWTSGAVGWLVLIGVCSQGIGVFATLVQREHLFSPSITGVSSIIAGVLAGYALSVFADAPPPAGMELVGAALIIAATVLLSVPQRVPWNGQAAFASTEPVVRLEETQDTSGATERGRD